MWSLVQKHVVLILDSGVLIIYEDAFVKLILVEEGKRSIVGVLEIRESLVVHYHEPLMLLILWCKHGVLPIFEVPLLRIDDFEYRLDVVLQAM